jgi:hypothetical protein
VGDTIETGNMAMLASNGVCRRSIVMRTVRASTASTFWTLR